MAIERKGNNVYYYRTRRVGNRFVRDYYGSGAAARLAAARFEIAREEKQRRRDRDAAQIQQICGMDDDLGASMNALDNFVHAVMYASGFRFRARVWRRYRGKYKRTAASRAN